MYRKCFKTKLINKLSYIIRFNMYRKSDSYDFKSRRAVSSIIKLPASVEDNTTTNKRH